MIIVQMPVEMVARLNKFFTPGHKMAFFDKAPAKNLGIFRKNQWFNIFQF